MSLDLGDGEIKVSGDLSFDRASQVFNSINFSAIENDQILIDMSAVDHCDSSALAVMLEWTHLANENDKQIRFSHLPEQLMQLIEMSNLQRLLNLST